jgi:hypothetical protein
MYELRRVEKKPADFMALVEKLLKRRCKEHAQAFCDSLNYFEDWGMTYAQAVVKFMEDSEWTWRMGRPALQDW